MTQDKKTKTEQNINKKEDENTNNTPMTDGDETGIKGKIKGVLQTPDGSMLIWIIILALVSGFVLTSFITPFTPFGTYKARVTLFETELTGIHKDVKSIQDGFATQDSKTSSAIKGMTDAVNSVSGIVTNQINTQLSTYAKQSDLQNTTNQVNSKISEISSKVSALDGIQAKIDASNKSITDGINPQLLGISANITALQNEINNILSIESANSANIALLQNNMIANNLVITSSISTANISTTVPISIPVIITNNGTTSVSIGLKLVLTTATSETISSAYMNITNTSTVTNPNVTFVISNINIPAMSTLTLNPQVTLTFTGTSPNVWNVAWSKN